VRLGRRRPDPLETPRTTSRRSVDRMKVVLDVSRLLSVPDLQTLLDQISRAASDLLGARAAQVFLFEPTRDELWTYQDGRIVTANDDVVRVFRGGDDRFPGSERLCALMRDLDRRVIGVVEVRHKLLGEFSSEERLLLELLAEHAAVAVQRFRLMREAAQGAELRREMELARRVQAALLPRSWRVRSLPAVGWTRSASITGGDCYDVWKLPDGHLGLFVADASGHGLAAALVISQVRSMLRALCEVRSEPEWLLSRLNARLVQDLDEGRFVTAFVGCLSTDGTLRWCSAGQGPIFVRRAAGSSWEAFPPVAMPLGVMAELDIEPAAVVQLEPGGVLVAMTDGLFESRNASGELFGPARVLTLLEACGDGTPDQIAVLVRDAVTTWRGREQPDDDETIVAVSFVPSA
jgi:phosphoserine phosphatase RsbU/P